MSTTPRILVLGTTEDGARLLWESVRTPDESLVTEPAEAGWLVAQPKNAYDAALVTGEPLQRLPTLLAFESVRRGGSEKVKTRQAMAIDGTAATPSVSRQGSARCSHG